MSGLFRYGNQNRPGANKTCSFRGIRPSGTQARGQCLELCLRLGNRNVGFKSRDNGEGSERLSAQWDLALQQRINLKAVGHGNPDLGQVLEADAAESWWRNPDNRELLPVNGYL